MIGRWLAPQATTPLRRAFVRLFGAPDWHTHLRLDWLQRRGSRYEGRVCELGSGTGVTLIELLLRSPRATAIGFEVDATAMATARQLANELGLEQRLEFHLFDLAAGVPAEVAAADVVLLLDVLEHLPSPAETAARIAERMQRGARLLVSVPTPLYPRIFGRDYHTLIGHLHDGFSLAQIDAWFAGLERTACRYSTGPLSWPGAFLYYRVALRDGAGAHGRNYARALRGMAAALSIPFRFADFLNGSWLSCSLLAEYRRPQAAGVGDAP